MSKNTKTFFIGMLVMMMILRPEIGSAVMRSFADGVENVTKVAFQRDRPVELSRKSPMKQPLLSFPYLNALSIS